MTIQQLYTLFRTTSGVATDSRSIRGGELFFALKGDRFDGNDYALQALESGAAYAVADRKGIAGERVIAVDDALQTLKALAAWHRNHVCSGHLPVIGLTGTNGKTTTKELIRKVLSKKFQVTATEGNLNNDIGVPLSVLKISPATGIAVIEMGASHPDDIQSLVTVCQPDFGLITNIGQAHLAGFGSYAGVKRAKGQLYDYLAARSGKAFVHADDPVLLEMAEERHLDLIRYGLAFSGAAILPVSADRPFLRISHPEMEIDTHLIGSYNAPNVLAAIAVGAYFGVSMGEAAEAVKEYEPDNSRSELRRTDKNIVIADLYNANPSSMAAALNHFGTIDAHRKAVLLGDMGELGTASLSAHIEILRQLDRLSLDKVCLAGEEFRKALEQAEKKDNTLWFKNSEALSEYLKAHPLCGFTLLVKGSRSTRMEKVLPML